MPPLLRCRRSAAAVAATATAAALSLFPAPAHAAQTACPASHLTPSHENVEQVQRTVLCLLNAERTKRGLKRLKSNGRLAKAATKHSKDMVSRDFFSHTSPAGTTPAARVKHAGYLSNARGWSVGENIAWGTGHYATPQETVESWMHSAGHKANILHRDYEEIGIGIALGSPGHGDDGATYTTNFGVRL